MQLRSAALVEAVSFDKMLEELIDRLAEHFEAPASGRKASTTPACTTTR